MGVENGVAYSSRLALPYLLYQIPHLAATLARLAFSHRNGRPGLAEASGTQAGHDNATRYVSTTESNVPLSWQDLNQGSNILRGNVLGNVGGGSNDIASVMPHIAYQLLGLGLYLLFGSVIVFFVDTIEREYIAAR